MAAGVVAQHPIVMQCLPQIQTHGGVPSPARGQPVQLHGQRPILSSNVVVDTGATDVQARHRILRKCSIS